MHLFVDISSHGFGHLAITAPVLNELARRLPGLRLTLRSALPPAKLRERIAPAFTLIEASTDFGYAMRDSTRIDLAASAAAYRAAHQDWGAKVAAEAAFLKQLAPDLVLTNVSYLPLSGAALAGIPGASLCSLNWADLFAHFFERESWAAPLHQEMLAAYRSALAFLRITPSMAMTQLDNCDSVGPIAAIGRRHDLGLGSETTCLVAMGGIAHRLPVENWPRLPGVRWLVPAAWQCNHPDSLTSESFGLPFTDLLCSVDAVVTKPGYGTFTEAACNGTPVIFQRREDWPEQDCLIDWLLANGRAAEITADALNNGQLEASILAVRAQASPPRPRPTGIAEAASRLVALAGLRVPA